MTLDGIADSGADAHLTGDSTLFVGFVCACHVPVNGIAGLAGGLIATGVGRGRIFIGGVCVDLSRLYYVPGAVKTLISISELVEDGCRVIAEKVCGTHVMTIEMANGKHAQLHVEDGLYAIPNEGHTNHAVWEDSWKACDQTDELHGCAMVMGKSVGNTHVGDLSLGQLYQLDAWDTFPAPTSGWQGEWQTRSGPRLPRGARWLRARLAQEQRWARCAAGRGLRGRLRAPWRGSTSICRLRCRRRAHRAPPGFL